MDAHTERKLLGLVGLGVRGRLVVVGVDRVREAVLNDKVVYAIVAPDASPNSLQKIVPMLRARRVAYVEGPSSADLGAAAGREATAVVGVVDDGLARGIRTLVETAGPEGRRGGGETVP